MTQNKALQSKLVRVPAELGLLADYPEKMNSRARLYNK